MKERIYILKRRIQAFIQSIPFYLFRMFPINNAKIVLTTIEGTTGYMCNPKYIAEELIKSGIKYELVWLVNDCSRKFPKEINVKKNSLFNRAYHLSTAKVWVDNSRKQLEVRKRKRQIYIQTWHAQIGFKPTGYSRKNSFSRIAELVSKHDSNMIDYMISNCDMFDRIAPQGLLYNGKIIRTGSPRLDILANRKEEDVINAKRKFGIESNEHVVIWVPTFRGGSQSTRRHISAKRNSLDFERVLEAFEKKTAKKCHILVKLHPQLAAKHIYCSANNERVIDVSSEDDIYEILIACDAIITDYSSVAFDAGVFNIPVFLYCDDYYDYINERGELLWDMRNIAFPFAETNEKLYENIVNFSYENYCDAVEKLMSSINMKEDGKASKRVAELIQSVCYKRGIDG